MNSEEIKLLSAQLRKREGLTTSKLAEQINVPYQTLSHYLHREGKLSESQQRRVNAFFLQKMEESRLTGEPLELRRDMLLKQGYGARVGTQNGLDPFVAEISAYIIQLHTEGGKAYTEIGRQAGVGSHVIADLGRGTSKTLQAHTKSKLIALVREANGEDREPSARPEGSCAAGSARRGP